MKISNRLFVGALSFGLLASAAPRLLADVTLPRVISNHMVLQQSEKTAVWGKADPGEDVTVTLDGRIAKAKADAAGKWQVELDLKNSAPGPFEMTVQGKNTLTVSDVLVGQVWVASGQSNMDIGLGSTLGSAEEIARSANPSLRQFRVEHVASPELKDDVDGGWSVASPETAAGFSGVGYYFGKTLQNALEAPVGILFAAWGATPSEAWTSAESLDTVPDLKEAKERHWRSIEEFPAKRAEFLSSFATWLKETGREDKPTPDVALYAGDSVSADGWTAIDKPCLVSSVGLPAHGVIWLRKEIDIPENLAGKKLFLRVAWNENYLSLYWNGQQLKDGSLEQQPGPGQGIGLSVPGEWVKAGRNVFAIRIFAPVDAATTPGPTLEEDKVGRIPLSDQWLGKAEFTFPPLEASAAASVPKAPTPPLDPSNIAAYLFNGMIQPILPSTIRGVIWYQGEGNAARAWQYRVAFPLLITDWRKQWRQPELPFYFCQLAGFMPKKAEPGDSNWAELRDAQLATLKLPHTGQAVLLDIGEVEDIHPINKKVAGERLAQIALKNDYGKAFAVSGPLYQSAKVENDKVLVQFSHVEGGLVAAPIPATYVVRLSADKTAPLVRNSPDSELEGFAICGEDQKWVWANAKIDGESVLVWSPQVPQPLAVRYAWADNPTANLYNQSGLPASPFRTDDQPLTTLEKKY